MLGALGKAITSDPFTCWNAMPPPLPASAPLPWIRLALISRPGPTPSLGPTDAGALTQSASLAVEQVGSASGVPMITKPPPLAGMVGFRLWLKITVLCSMSPFQLKPRWPRPPPSPLLRLPQIQLYWNLYRSAPVQMLTPPAPAR